MDAPGGLVWSESGPVLQPKQGTLTLPSRRAGWVKWLLPSWCWGVMFLPGILTWHSASPFHSPIPKGPWTVFLWKQKTITSLKGSDLTFPFLQLGQNWHASLRRSAQRPVQHSPHQASFSQNQKMMYFQHSLKWSSWLESYFRAPSL